MFKIKSFTENGKSYVELHNSLKTTSIKICLDQGARLQELKFNNVYLINEQSNFDYGNSYASSLLFPFASRIENGKYKFQGEEYQFKCNDSGKSALHGLVYDKKFKFFESEENSHSCFATFNYNEKNLDEGFPFTYFFSVTYTIYENSMKVNINIKNTDEKAFPFTLGWHPYFNIIDAENSHITFNSNHKIQFDENLITKEVVVEEIPKIFKIKDKQLDDCFILNDNKIGVYTPLYNIEMTQSSEKNFLQLFTPKNIPVIAIEPMTGVSNSFNNNIGLQVLEPKNTYSFGCEVKLVD